MKFEGTADSGATAATGAAVSVARSLPARGSHGTGRTGVAGRRRCLSEDVAAEGLRQVAAGAPARPRGTMLDCEVFERLAAAARGRST